MKTKTLITIGVIGMALAFATSAQAQAHFSINVSFGFPVAYRAPVVVAQPRVIHQPVQVCAPRVFIPPGHLKKMKCGCGQHHGYGQGRGQFIPPGQLKKQYRFAHQGREEWGQRGRGRH